MRSRWRSGSRTAAPSCTARRGWSASGSGATDANAAPAFTSPSTFGAAENQTAAGTVEAEDSDDAVTGYVITGGADAGFFSIGATSGALAFDAAPDFEDAQDQDAGNTYEVTVQATSGTGTREKMATQAITVTVMDAEEQPEQPAKPTVTAVSGSTDSLDVSWSEPDLNGGPAITGYGVEYREGTSGTWTDWSHIGTDTMATITGLMPDTDYQVQVRALNGETPSAWSDPSDVVRTNAEMTTPAAPTGFTAMVGNAQVTLGWDAPASGSGVTRHEYRQKTTGSYPATWTQITNSGVGGANQAGFTVTGLTNEVAHTFELRAANASGEGAATQAGPVTPTPGICDRTQQVQDEILDKLASVSDCAAVTVANLATITGTLDFDGDGLTSLQAGDFAGLTEMWGLDLTSNSLSSLPDGVFSGLRSLQNLYLPDNGLSLLPDGVFSGLTALEWLYLHDNDLSLLPNGVFFGLTSLRTLDLGANPSLGPLPGDVFSGLTKLRELHLSNTGLETLPAEMFSGLTELRRLYLSGNQLTELPAGVFSGLSQLYEFHLGSNSANPMPLAVTVEKVGTDQVRAKVLAGAPFAVDIPVTVANGALVGGAAALRVATGSVESTSVTVTRTAGTTAAVTADVDLTTQPSLPALNTGYVFARASSGLPAEILPAVPTITDVAITSTPVLATDTYGFGETIRITVTFSAAVVVTGDPVLTFELGNSGAAREVDAAYESGSGTAALVFAYTVLATDVDDDGIFRVADALMLETGEAIASAVGVDADLEHAAGSVSESGHKVDGSRTTGNNAPVFSAATATRAVPENSAPDIAVGAAVTATDADNDTLTYSLEETDDHESFAIDSSSGQIQTVSGVTYDHEAAQNSYSVTVRADDGNGGTDTIDVTVNVTDVDEQPDKPAKPMVTAASATSLSVSWSAPDNDGPEITDYDYRYRTRSPQGAWMEVTNTTITALSATITGLAENTEYDVQVRATNDEGTGAWSASGSGTTVGPSSGGICDRTPRVRDRILVLLKYRHSYKGDCSGVKAEHLAKLTSLDLRRNPSTESAFSMGLRRNDFEGLLNLVELDLADTGLESLPAGVFDGLASLETLNLNKNRLRSLPAGVFAGLWSLETLRLQQNPSLRSLPYDEFEALPALTLLRVDPAGRRKLQVAGGEGDAALEVAAGGSVTYPVRLMAAPDFRVTAANPVRIGVSSDTAGVVAAPATLRFTKENWFRRQTVTVRVQSSASGTAELAHEASGTTTDSQGQAQSNYDFEDYPLPKVTVRVLESDTSRLDDPLTADFQGLPASHDGETAFSFRIAFSEAVSVTPEAMRTRVLTVAGGAVTGAARVDGESGVWAIEVTPDTREALSIALAPAADCEADGAVCTADGRALSVGAAHIVSGPGPETQTQEEPALTASFEGLPAEHRGQGSFRFRVAFSEEIKISYKTVRDASFTVTGGDVTGAGRVDGRRDLWEIRVEPASDKAVTIRLPETSDCGASGAICTSDGRPLSHSQSATVSGPVGISVADARVEEGAGAVLAFAVTLSRAASAALTVDYATADGSAHAGDDYRAARGTLKFRAGESSKTIEVTVLDDAHDEGEETLALRLSNASSGRLADGEATGTIKNHDPMPRALLARFGRTAAVHVVEHVEERLAAPREPGFRGRFAGRELRRGMERDIALNFLRQLGGTAGAGPLGAGAGGPLSGAPAAGTAPFGMPGPAGGGGHLAAVSGSMGGAMPMGGAPGAMGMASGPRGGAAGAMGMGAGPLGGGSGPDGGLDRGRLLRMGLGGGDVLTGSDFALGRETGHGGILPLWSRGAQSRFSGREGALSLGGDVRTTMFGADYAKGPLVTGLSLSHSRGLGEYAGVAGGQVASSVTGLYPWLGYKATERVTVWGVAGYGSGGLL